MHRMRIFQKRARLEDFDIGVFQIADIDAVEAINLAVLVLDKFFPGKTRLAHRPAETRCVLELF